MGLINYKNIDFNQSINKTLKTFDFNGSEIAVVPYLSIDDKYDLVMVTLQKSFEKGIYNHVKLDMYFDLHLVYMYTNIEVSEDDRQDEAKVYDIFKRSGLIDRVKECIDSSEIDLLLKYIYDMEKIIIAHRNTLGAVIGTFIEQLPENMEMAANAIKDFDPEKYQSLLSIAGEIKANAPDVLSKIQK